MNPRIRFSLAALRRSFFLHGDPDKAFDAYLDALKVEMRNGHEKAIESLMIGLKALANKIGLSGDAMTTRIAKGLGQPAKR